MNPFRENRSRGAHSRERPKRPSSSAELSRSNGSRSSFRPSTTPSTRGAEPTKRRSRSEPRSSSESEQEHHDPREVRAPTAEQNATPFYTPSAAEHHSPTTAAGAGQSSQRLSCTGTARRSELTQSGGTETERAAHHSSGENLRPDSGRRLHFAELPAMIQRSRQQKTV